MTLWKRFNESFDQITEEKAQKHIHQYMRWPGDTKIALNTDLRQIRGERTSQRFIG